MRERNILILWSISIFKRFLLNNLARKPWTFLANLARSWTLLASFFRRRSGASKRSPWRFRCCSMCSCWGIFYAAAAAASERSPGVAPRGLQAAALSGPTWAHGERWLLLPLMHAYAIAVVTSYVRCMCMRPRVGWVQRIDTQHLRP